MKEKLTLQEISRAARITKGLPEHDFAHYGMLGGLAKTAAKSKSAKRNGRKGGRPVRILDKED